MTDPFDPIRPLTIEQVRLDPVRFAARFSIDDGLKVRMDRYRMIEAIEKMAFQTIVQIERDVHEDRLLSATETVPFRRVVPWAVTVPIVYPRTWWQRLLGRPHVYRWKQIHGEVEVTGEVDVNITDGRTFPDTPTYPDELGQPIVYQTVNLGHARYTGARSRATGSQTTTADGTVLVTDEDEYQPYVSDDGRDFDNLDYEEQNEAVEALMAAEGLSRGDSLRRLLRWSQRRSQGPESGGR